MIEIKDQKADADIAGKLKVYSDQIAEVKTTSAGATTAAELPNPRLSDFEGATVSVRNSETALGNLITDGMLDKAKEFNPNTVIAIQNGGGIRAAIDQGDITLGDAGVGVHRYLAALLARQDVANLTAFAIAATSA